jgi:ABC-type arginine/histidine transport system permease subunit
VILAALFYFGKRLSSNYWCPNCYPIELFSEEPFQCTVLAYHGDVAAGQLALFQGAIEVPEKRSTVNTRFDENPFEANGMPSTYETMH